MKYRIWKASTLSYSQPCADAIKENDNWFVEVNTLEDLNRLCEEVDCDIIFNSKEKVIVVYDDYLE
jgi:hypothetical protein